MPTHVRQKGEETIMRRVSWVVAAVCLLVSGITAQAQDKYPSKPIKVLVPYGPGSATDIAIRIVGEEMRHTLGQPVIVENKPGAFGIIAIEEMARAKPDGYTLQVGNSGTNSVAPLIYKNKFKIDYDKDVVLVTRLSELPLIVVVNPSLPVKTMAEFVAYCKAHPDMVRYASVGIGSNNHFDTENFARAAGIKLVHIPIKAGGAGIAQAVLTNDANMTIVNAASSRGMVAAGKLRPLAVIGDKRLAEYPDVPSMAEVGFKGVGSGLWGALYAPAATPRPVLETLHKGVVAALNSEPVKTAFAKQMIKPIPDASLEAAAEWNKKESAYWQKITSEVKVDLN
jgi:tripartite-type tricarboxylate transporter receptor subunit TctC